MEEIKSHLENKGWFLSDNGLNYIQDNLETEVSNVNDIIKEALNTDLRKIGKGYLPHDLSKQKLITGPLILQLLSVLNLSAPIQNQHLSPRFLQLLFTDGVKKVKGIEIFGHVENVSLDTPPGTKFLVTNEITVHDNLLYLGPNLLKNLGGEVDEMIREWRVGKQFIVRGHSSTKKNNYNYEIVEVEVITLSTSSSSSVTTYNQGTYNQGTHNQGTYNTGTYNQGNIRRGGGYSNPAKNDSDQIQ
ncbi:2814_t:CDS:2 [Diversispora eburnea]|uniref:2814_t:CDS:1 n=1 Tax=Diversispora eburnea TaxID=1213867 RepID=A0A9N8YPG5_9GLOM|nr:2814_t:CDS:2 [Diversispora eburnea]